jgi:hypothetical protein
MLTFDTLDFLFVATAFLFQLILILHFALRKWRFNTAIRFGPFVYALSIPAAVVSLVLMRGGKNWSLWLGGFLFLTWALFGFWIEYIRKIEWRNSWRWQILVPYVLLYLSTSMFYWFPLALLWKPLWYIFAVLFGISVFLNVTSHKKPVEASTNL